MSSRQLRRVSSLWSRHLRRVSSQIRPYLARLRWRGYGSTRCRSSMPHAHALCAVAALGLLATAGAFAPSSILSQGQALGCRLGRSACVGTFGRGLARRRVGSLALRAVVEPGEEGFKDIEYRLKKLEKEAKEYKGTDQEDLADGLKDDINETRERLNKARKASQARMMKRLAIGAAAAAAIGAAVFALGPRKAYAATLTKEAEAPAAAQSDAKAPFIAADEFQGAKPGYVFQQGPEGSGYYLAGDAVHQTAAGKNIVMQLAEDPKAVAAASFAAGVSVPVVAGKLRKGKKDSSAQAFSGMPFTPPTATPAANPFTPPPAAKPSVTKSAAAVDPFEAKPADAMAGKDPAVMRASELKKAITELGGNTSGIVEKDELVALYKKLKSEPREIPTTKYNPSADADDSIAKDFQNFDPNAVDPAAVDEMMKNPMMRTLSNQMMNDPEAIKELQDAMSGGKGMGEVMKSAKFQEMAKSMMADPEVSKMMQAQDFADQHALQLPRPRPSE